MIDVSERKLKEILNTRVKKEVINKEHLDYSNEIYYGEQGEFLKQKSYELALINVKGSLALGKIFEEVYQKLGREKGEGVYIEWLNINNYNRITAWRYRQKYNLYMEVSEKGKERVALMPFRVISDIYKQDETNRKAIIELLNDGANIAEIKDILALEHKDIIENEKPIFTFENFNFKKLEKNIKENYQSLQQKDKEKVLKLLKKLNDILG